MKEKYAVGLTLSIIVNIITLVTALINGYTIVACLIGLLILFILGSLMSSYPSSNDIIFTGFNEHFYKQDIPVLKRIIYYLDNSLNTYNINYISGQFGDFLDIDDIAAVILGEDYEDDTTSLEQRLKKYLSKIGRVANKTLVDQRKTLIEKIIQANEKNPETSLSDNS